MYLTTIRNASDNDVNTLQLWSCATILARRPARAEGENDEYSHQNSKNSVMLITRTMLGQCELGRDGSRLGRDGINSSRERW